MKKLSIFIISALLLLGLVSQVRAEQSPQTATGTRYQDNQVFTVAYNNYTSEISANSVVVLDTTATANSTLGAYITGTTTADDKYVFGVTDEAIGSGKSGRICIRGPHVVWTQYSNLAAGAIAAPAGYLGSATTYSASDGTAGGQLGYALGAEYTNSTGNHSDWIWVNPRIHK